MRLVRALVTEDNRDAIVDILREKDVDFVVGGGTEESAGGSIIEFPVPTDGLGDVLDAARDAGLEDEYVVILTAENAITPNSETLWDRYATDYDPLRPPELRSKARNLSQDPLSYAAMIFLSAAIAAIGLLVDSPAIVVGSMVIAPLVGPTLTATVGGLTGDRAMVIDSIRIQALGLVSGIVGALAVAAFMRFSGFMPTPLDIDAIELIGIRMAPGLPSILVGIAAGTAAAFGLTTKGTSSLIGVMIAAALIPAAAVVGIAITWGEPLIALGAGGLLVSTMAAINLAMYTTLWVLYRSHEFETTFPTDHAPTRAGIVTAALIVLAVAVAGIGTYEQAVFQHTVTGEVESVLDDPGYEGLSVVSIRTQYGGTDPFAQPESVTITVVKNANASYPALSRRLHERISGATDSSTGVVINVQFASLQQTSSSVKSHDSARLVPSHLPYQRCPAVIIAARMMRVAICIDHYRLFLFCSRRHHHKSWNSAAPNRVSSAVRSLRCFPRRCERQKPNPPWMAASSRRTLRPIKKLPANIAQEQMRGDGSRLYPGRPDELLNDGVILSAIPIVNSQIKKSLSRVISRLKNGGSARIASDTSVPE